MFYQQTSEYPKTQFKEKTYSQEKKNIKAIDWNCTGQYLATGDTTIKIWNFDGNNIKKLTDIKCKIIKKLDVKEGQDQLECLLFHPQNPDLLAAITKEHVRIWDIKNKVAIRQEKKEFSGPASWHPNGNVIACATKYNKEQQIQFIDLNGKNDFFIQYQQPKEKLEKHTIFEMKCMAYDPKGDVLVVGGIQNNVGVFQLLNAYQPELPPMETIDCHQAAITSLAFSKEGNYLATGGADALILIWSLPELINVASFLSIESEVKSLSFSYDEKWLSAVGNEELFYVYSVEKGLTGICDHIDTVKCDEKTPQVIVYHPFKSVVAFVCQNAKDSVVHLYGQLSV